jgi:hypothetical protein
MIYDRVDSPKPGTPRFKKLLAKVRAHFPNRRQNGKFLPPADIHHLEILEEEAELEPFRRAARKSAVKVFALLGFALFSALGCNAFGLALWCLALAAHETLMMNKTVEQLTPVG